MEGRKLDFGQVNN